MELVLGILSFLVAVLVLLQGWRMVQYRKSNNNPGSVAKLDEICSTLGRIEQRINDIWGKVNK